MRIPAFLGLIVAVAALPAPAEARRDSASAGQAHARHHVRVIHHRWGPRIVGRWYAGWRAPGGWGGYHRPFRGYVIPGYWFAPTYYIGNYARYGLGHPPYGLAWSRYYDDAVLIDGRGTVYDSVSDVDWDGYDEGDYRRDRRRRDDGVGGALIGGAVGALAGSAIAGRGDRTGGALIGAGVGAIAGMVIDKAEDKDGRIRDGKHRPGHPEHDYDYRFGDDRVTEDGVYAGSWSGVWEGGYTDTDKRRYEGKFRGTYRGDAPAASYGDYPASHGGYPGGHGYYYPGPVITTITIHPSGTVAKGHVAGGPDCGKTHVH